MKKTCSRGHVFEKTSSCPTCPACWPKLKRKLLAGSDLPAALSAPAIRALEHAGLRSLAHVAKRTERQVAELHGMGPKGVAALKRALRSKKLAFKRA